jgi:hypothetical protein
LVQYGVMTKNKQRLWLLSILLMYVAIAVAGFVIVYIIKTDFFPNHSSEITATPTPSQITRVPAPAGWQTYTDTDYQLTFAYPSTDTVKNKAYGFGVSGLTLQNAAGTDFQILLLPKQLSQAIGQDFASYYTMANNSTKVVKSPLSQDTTTTKFTKISNRSVNGLRAIDYQSIASDAASGTQPEIGTFVEMGDNLALISTDAGNKTRLEKLLKTFQYPM